MKKAHTFKIKFIEKIDKFRYFATISTPAMDREGVAPLVVCLPPKYRNLRVLKNTLKHIPWDVEYHQWYFWHNIPSLNQLLKF